jgi:hypothetical protein
VNPSVSEHDLELLETYLDNELAPNEMDTMRVRLKREPSLALALDQLTRDRQLRHQVFFMMDREVAVTARSSTDAIARSLKQAAVREVASSNRRNIFRQVSAAAACIVVGLLVGWFGRERTQEMQIARPMHVDSTADVQSDAVTVSDDTAPGGFTVAITDDRGRVLAQQRFGTLNEARQATNDVARWQTRQREVRNSDVRLVRDGF